jgi:hypothetical protein
MRPCENLSPPKQTHHLNPAAAAFAIPKPPLESMPKTIKIGLRIRKHLSKQKKRNPSPPAIFCSLLEEEEAEPQ